MDTLFYRQELPLHSGKFPLSAIICTLLILFGMSLPCDMLQDSRITLATSALYLNISFSSSQSSFLLLLMSALRFFTLSFFVFVIISCVYSFNLYLFLKIQEDAIFRSLFFIEARNEDIVSSIGAWQLLLGDNLYWCLLWKNLVSLWPVSMEYHGKCQVYGQSVRRCHPSLQH